jgi:hypothetical protein
MTTNRSGRKVWFRPVLWNCWPCHWKGWLVQTVLILAGLALIGTLALLESFIAHPKWTGPTFLVVIATDLIALQLIAERHGLDRS